MTRFLLATRSVHTTAAAADYLQSRLSADDTVVVATVVEPEMDPRDAGDAANVARSRLVPATVETIQREGDPSTVVPALVKEFDADELLVGPRCGDPGADAALGETARTVLTAVRVPVVVLPLPDL
ncbi:universal stress protein [Haloarculaceae archaeon H-GB1-1]|nr:universal stress protein [Haloarculaceae archaeon H-GB1-1]